MFVLMETVVLSKHYLVQVQQPHPTWPRYFTFKVCVKAWPDAGIPAVAGLNPAVPIQPTLRCSFLLLVPKGSCHGSVGFSVCLRGFQGG